MLDTAQVGVRAETAVPRAEDAVRSALVSHYAFYERLARRRADSASDAADIVQSFALKALERAAQLRDPCAVRGWLRRIFETSVIDHFRVRMRIRQCEASLQATNAAMEDARSQPTLGDETQLIHATMRRLKSEYAEIICRVDLQDQTTEQIADDLGITTNNLSVRLHRARAAFRTALDRRPLPRHHARSMPGCGARAGCEQCRFPPAMWQSPAPTEAQAARSI